MKWQEIKLEEIADFRNGLNYTKNNNGEGLKVVNVKDFQDLMYLNYDSLEEINPAGLPIDKSLLEENDILFVRSNGNKDLVGRSVHIIHPPENLSFSGFCIRLRFKKSTFNTRFYAYFFRSPLFRKKLSLLGSGTNISNLNQKVLNSLYVPIPLESEQNKIADILSKYDETIANNRRRIELLERSSRLLYREWFVYLRFPGHEHGAIGSDGIPEGWERRKITDLCIVTDGTHDSPKASDTGYFLVTGKHIINGFIDFSKCYLISDDDHKQVMQRSKPEKGDVIFSNIGTLGSTVLVDQDFEFSIKNVALFKPKSREKYSAFLYFYFSDPWTLSYMEGQSLGTSQKFFSLKLLRGLEITVPSKLILTTFNDFVVSLLQQRTLLHSTNQKLQAARDLLLPRLMNGEINV